MKPTKQKPVIELTKDRNALSDQQIRWLRDKYNVQKKTQGTRTPDRQGTILQVTMTFEEWLTIWLDSGKLHLRGNGKEGYCMARNNDLGDYAVGNVTIKSIEENSREGKLGRGGMKGRVSPTKGMKWSKATKDKRSAAALARDRFPCEYCAALYTKATLARHHGPRCRHAPTQV